VAPLTFQEARGCKDWLNALPLTNIPQAQAQVLEVLRGLNSGEFNALERLKCLELMRDKIAFLQGEQRARYFGKSLPLSPNDEAAWSTGLALLAEMETGYRGAASGLSGELAAHRALCEQRIARYLGAQMLFHAAVYRRFDPGLWRRLHGLYRGAEEAGIAAEGVKDSLEAPAGSSIAEAYLHIVMLQAAYLSELSANHIDYVEALLRMWLRKVTLQASARMPQPPTCWRWTSRPKSVRGRSHPRSSRHRTASSTCRAFRPACESASTGCATTRSRARWACLRSWARSPRCIFSSACTGSGARAVRHVRPRASPRRRPRASPWAFPKSGSS
jgi:hypothetical protein